LKERFKPFLNKENIEGEWWNDFEFTLLYLESEEEESKSGIEVHVPTSSARPHKIRKTRR
jgi:hypothetical protein